MRYNFFVRILEIYFMFVLNISKHPFYVRFVFNGHFPKKYITQWGFLI